MDVYKDFEFIIQLKTADEEYIVDVIGYIFKEIGNSGIKREPAISLNKNYLNLVIRAITDQTADTLIESIEKHERVIGTITLEERCKSIY